MREIKFRVWNKQVKKLFYLDRHGLLEDSLEQVLFATNIIEADEEAGSNFELMQFTGLKDKNGREIYEGDILQWCDTSTVKTKWTVEATDGGWYPFIEQMLTDRPDRFEVIGNIYENPGLLGQ